MIRTKEDYLAYVQADRIALGVEGRLSEWLFDDVWRFQRRLRKTEYLVNTHRGWLRRKWATWRYMSLGRTLGFSIPINTFGPGLSIAHRGTIVVNSKARIGANCRLHVCVNIGESTEPGSTPVLGDNCYIAPGVKIFGRIVIGHDTALGANAVVNKNFPEGHVTLAGAPARVVNRRGSTGMHTHGYPRPFSTLTHPPSAARKTPSPTRVRGEPVLHREGSSQAG